MPIRRIAVVSASVLLLALVAYAAWQAYALQRDLVRAESSVAALRTALTQNDPAARDRAISDLQASATAAADRTDGRWWSAMPSCPTSVTMPRGSACSPTPCR